MGRRGRYFIPNVEFRYEVDGQTYTGDRFGGTGIKSKYEEDIYPILDQYARGSKHSVSYNPENPERAVLDPNWNSFPYLVLLVPLFCLLGPLLLYSYGMATVGRLMGL